MPNPRTSTTGVLAAVLLVIVLLPAGYLGAYYAMVDRVYLEWETIPDYRVEGDAVNVFFEPAHWIDRSIRPGYWG